jgi:hypothetical protein
VDRLGEFSVVRKELVPADADVGVGLRSRRGMGKLTN